MFILKRASPQPTGVTSRTAPKPLCQHRSIILKLIRSFCTSGTNFITRIKNLNLQPEMEALGKGQLVKTALLVKREQGINPEHISLAEGRRKGKIWCQAPGSPHPCPALSLPGLWLLCFEGNLDAPCCQGDEFLISSCSPEILALKQLCPNVPAKCSVCVC